MHKAYYHSPSGLLEIIVNDIGVTELSFRKEMVDLNDEPISSPILLECIAQLKAYFEGKSRVFDLPLDPAGTGFQKTVWTELQKIPFGKTVSYLDIAKNLGDPNKIRAVGGANGKNPIAIVIPCHRVIGSDGSLTGYAGGMDKKRWLLTFEGAIGGGLFD
jgi:methylated-DNA-[protein]-cysteine S-methyltransferase